MGRSLLSSMEKTWARGERLILKRPNEHGSQAHLSEGQAISGGGKEGGKLGPIYVAKEVILWLGGKSESLCSRRGTQTQSSA